MSVYIFHEAGVIPGVPGTFSNCRVEVGDDGQVTVLPLAPTPAPLPAPATGGAEEPPIEIESATVVPEQAPATSEPVIALHLPQ